MAAPFFSQSWYRVASLRPALRNHAQMSRHRYRGRTWYVLYDPLSGQSHRFAPAAYLIISSMNGRRTLQELWEAAAQRLGEHAPSQDDFISLLAQLHAADVLQSNMTPDAAEIFERTKKQSQRTLKANLRNPLALRIPLWDPDAFLARTLPRVQLAFGWGGAAVWMAVVAPALLLALQHWNDLTHNLGDRVLALDNVIVLWLLFPAVKFLHELGHAYATKFEGGEVHELGIMLLVFSPVPYVDSSAANALRSKWRRALIGAAGMLVEVFVASLALYLWLLAEPGLVRTIAFNIMLIAGVSTLIFNLNPLLRYDGYYILSDLIEMPNLASRTARYWGYLAQRYLFGDRQAGAIEASRGERRWFRFYGPVSLVYRVVLMLSIGLFVASAYPFVGVGIAIWGLVTTLVLPIGRALRHLTVSPRLARIRGRAYAVSGALAAALALVALMVPLPNRTSAEGVVWVPEKAQVRAGTDGFVQRFLVAPGTEVKRGDPLIESRDAALEAQVRVLQARLSELDTKVSQLLFTDRVQAEVLRQERDAAEAELTRFLERADALVARAQSDGMFLIAQPDDMPGRFFRKGELLGYVSQGAERVVRTMVSQDDIDLVRGKLRAVQVRLAGHLREPMAARVAREVPAGLDELPSRVLSAEGGGSLAADPRDPKGVKTLQRWFQVDLEISSGTSQFLGTRAYVRFDHEPEPLAVQLYRRVRQVFLSRFNV
jgi:putative peptide zinc metalloprotease protein